MSVPKGMSSEEFVENAIKVCKAIGYKTPLALNVTSEQQVKDLKEGDTFTCLLYTGYNTHEANLIFNTFKSSSSEELKGSAEVIGNGLAAIRSNIHMDNDDGRYSVRTFYEVVKTKGE